MGGWGRLIAERSYGVPMGDNVLMQVLFRVWGNIYLSLFFTIYSVSTMSKWNLENLFCYGTTELVLLKQ